MFEFALEKTLWSSTGEMQLQVDLQLQPGALVALYGKSGAGKTSLLRILAGLMQPEQGRISVQQQLWLDTETGVNLAPKDRPLGFLFQDYALFPNMTVLENLQFALPKPKRWARVGKWSKAQKQGRSRQIADLLEIMELGELRHRKPATLSGGQQQRVALARALVQRPKLLMLDEPLSALDYDMRLRLQQYILQVHRDFGLTTILVSHDLGEIWRLSDQVWLLEQGKIICQGTPAEVFGLQVNSNQLRVVGEVVAIAPQAQGWELTCLVGRDLLKIVVGRTKINNLASDLDGNLGIGAQVLITGDLTHPTVQPMGQS